MALESAPYFAAFVSSSCTISANVCTADALKRTSGPVRAHALGEAGKLGIDDVLQGRAAPACLHQQLVRAAERMQAPGEDLARFLGRAAGDQRARRDRLQHGEHVLDAVAQLAHEDREALLRALAHEHLLLQALGRLGKLGRALLDPLLQARVRVRELGAHLLQLHEDPDLGTQDFGDDRRQDVVDRAERIAFRRLRLVGERRYEDDGRMARAAALADQLGRLVSGHPRHVHVEQDDREIPLDQLQQRLLARGDGHDVLIEIIEARAIDQMLFGQVVDDQDIDPL